MFPSSSSGNDPFPFTGQSFMNDENPNSGSSSLFFHFPPPFLDDNDEFLMTHFFSPEPLLAGSTKADSTIMEDNQVTGNAAAEPTVPAQTLQKKRRNAGKKLVPRKRTGKKDRHSKIFTATGLRDRRMRLSVQIARKFFDLQDILGFDKASKTIDWLITNSKAAIKELTGNLPKVKHNRHEVVLGKKKIADNGNQIKDFVGNMPMEKSGLLALKRSREKARERARARTREKMMIRNLEKHRTCSDQENPTNLELSQSSNSGSHDTNSSLKVVAEVEEPITQLLEHQMDSVTIVENFLGGSTSRAPDLPASWEMDNAGSKYSGCALTNMNLLAGNTQERNPNLISMGTSNSQDCYPNSIFMASPNFPEQNPISIFLNTQEQDPSLLFMSPSYIQEQNPSSIMPPSNIRIGSQFF